MTRARGYSFLEVVVMATMGFVVLGLLVPAVTKVRAAAARARCANHLKQIGTGFLAFHDIRGHYPAGGSPRPDRAAATPTDREAGGWTWAYLLLPHLGHEGLYLDADPDVVRRGAVDVYLCPARRTAPDAPWLAKIDYAVNGTSHGRRPAGVIAATGVPPVRLSDLNGETGGVVVLAGKRLNLAALGTSRDDDDSFATAGWGPDYEVHRTVAVPPAPDVTEPGNLEPRAGFGASHPGVFCAGFADGSVRPMRYTIDPLVWKRACRRVATPPPLDD